MFVSLQNSLVRVLPLTPKMVVFGEVGLQEITWFRGGHERWNYKKRKETRSFSFCHMRILQARKRVPTRNSVSWQLDLRIPGLQNCETEILLA